MTKKTTTSRENRVDPGETSSSAPDSRAVLGSFLSLERAQAGWSWSRVELVQIRCEDHSARFRERIVATWSDPGVVTLDELADDIVQVAKDAERGHADASWFRVVMHYPATPEKDESRYALSFVLPASASWWAQGSGEDQDEGEDEARPLTVEIHGSGIDVSVRLDGARGFGQLLSGIRSWVGEVTASVVDGASVKLVGTDLADLFRRMLDLRARSEAPPCDDELDELARAVSQEQARRAQARS